MRALHFAFCTLLASASLMNALGQGNEMTLQFVAFPKRLKPEPVELLIGKEKTINVDTPGHELTQPYKVPNLKTITVGKTVQGEDGKPVFQVYGKADSVAPQQIILLIRKGKQDSDGFFLIPIDGRLPNFGGASFLFVNASNIGFAGIIGDQKFALRPGKLKIIKPKPNHPPNICQVTLSYQREDTDKWKKFYDTRWPANDKVRSLVFFYQIPGTKRVGLAPIMQVMNKNRPRKEAP